MQKFITSLKKTNENIDAKLFKFLIWKFYVSKKWQTTRLYLLKPDECQCQLPGHCQMLPLISHRKFSHTYFFVSLRTLTRTIEAEGKENWDSIHTLNISNYHTKKFNKTKQIIEKYHRNILYSWMSLLEK